MTHNWSVEHESNLAEYECRKEYEEWLASVDASVPLEEPEVIDVPADLCDIVREHEESMTEEEIEAYQRQILRFDFPYELE